MKEKLMFLKSTRFWKVVLIGVLEGLVLTGVIDNETSQTVARLLEFVLGTSVAIRTVDRLGEKSGNKDTK